MKGNVRWVRWALLASVAVNVAVAVAVAAALLGGGPDGRRGDGRDGARRGFGGPPEIGALAGGLDRERRGRLFRALRADEGLRDGRERMRAAQDGVIAALEAEPFDRAAFEAAMLAQRDLQGALAGRGIAALSDIIADLPQGERADLAARIAERRRR